MLKIALINNMNNNFFSLMRYLLDKGLEAHLFQVDSLDNHFLPSCDTFDYDNLQSNLHFVSSMTFRDFFRLPFSIKHQTQLKKLKRTLEKFDLVIACGGLAILEWAGIKVDIFVPHGGDLYQSPFMFDYCIKKHFPYSVLMKRYIGYQRRAIANSRAIVSLANIDRHMYDALIKLNEKWLNWGIPMIYPLGDTSTKKWEFMKQHDFILFSHARQGWKTALDYKGNDRAIRAFSRFIKIQSSFSKPIMVLFEYGPDVDASKLLISELKMNQYVKWMPTMPRKFIYEGLQKASLVFDYFHDEVVSFGGVTFEAFSCSTPVIGNRILKNVQAELSIPLVQAYTEDDILNVLMDYSQNLSKYIDYGKSSRKWFNEHVGEGLVNKYVDLINYLVANKTLTLKKPTFQLHSALPFIGPDHIK